MLPQQNTQRVLLAGFGGLLALLAFTGLDTIRVLREIQNRNDTIRSEFLTRNRLLNQIRADLYLSGTYVRDYLQDPAPEKAESHRVSLDHARRDMEAKLQQYARFLRTNERPPFASLEKDLAQYWAVLDPVMQWDSNERAMRSAGFLRDEVYPRRTAMLAVADEIGNVNEHQLNRGTGQVLDLFSFVRVRLSLTLLITFALGLLLAGYSMRRILSLERESAMRFEETAQARTELKQLSARLVEAQETERRAISRELHDEVGQSLSALVVGLGNLATSAPVAQIPGLRDQIGELRQLAGASVGVVRNMALLLRPSMLDDLGLVPALQWQGREIAKRSGLDVNISADELTNEIPEDHKTAVYRVVQEALHNCEKHARATEVRVTVRQQRDSLLISIKDDGCGFGPSTQKGLGLRGMQERIENLGGLFNVESSSGQGSLITVRLPIEKNRNGSRRERN